MELHLFEQGGDCTQWDGGDHSGICGSPDFFMQIICTNGIYRVIMGCDDSTQGEVNVCVISCDPFYLVGCITMLDTGTPPAPCCLGQICFVVTEA